jgi:hypothetical protein
MQLVLLTAGVGRLYPLEQLGTGICANSQQARPARAVRCIAGWFRQSRA